MKLSRLLIFLLLLVTGFGLLWQVGGWLFSAATDAPPREPGSNGHGVSLVSRDNNDEPLRALPPPPRLDAAKVALGRQLFHDPRLSGDDSIACFNCHDLGRGGVDGLPRSIGVGGAVGGINAPSVLMAANNFRQFWDGRAATLEEQAAGPVTNPLEMASTWPQVLAKLNADAELKKAFVRLYPEGLTPATVVAAIAEFERSLPRPSRFDRWLNGDERAISGDELSGYRVFKRHGCTSCHQGVNVGGNLYQRFGVMANYFATKKDVTPADLGRYNVTHRDEDRHIFKVPSLRNVALTAPYFHDASAATLEEAVRIMGRYQLGVDLPRQDVALIVAFLKSLTSEETP